MPAIHLARNELPWRIEPKVTACGILATSKVTIMEAPRMPKRL